MMIRNHAFPRNADNSPPIGKVKDSLAGAGS
jgi:hypothetical protein